MIEEANQSLFFAKDKILAAYKYATEKEGLTPREAGDLIKSQLKSKLMISDRYMRQLLPAAAKDQSKARDYSEREDEGRPSAMSELEKFRQEKGRSVEQEEQEGREEEEDELSKRIPDEFSSHDPVEHMPRPIYDNVESIMKQNEERIKWLLLPFKTKKILELKDQIIPLIIEVDPDLKDVTNIELDRAEMKKLKK